MYLSDGEAWISAQVFSRRGDGGAPEGSATDNLDRLLDVTARKTSPSRPSSSQLSIRTAACTLNPSNSAMSGPRRFASNLASPAPSPPDVTAAIRLRRSVSWASPLGPLADHLVDEHSTRGEFRRQRTAQTGHQLARAGEHQPA
jgi:hypothetical protein